MGIGKAGAMEGQEGKGFEGHVMHSKWANLIYKWIQSGMNFFIKVGKYHMEQTITEKM